MLELSDGHCNIEAKWYGSQDHLVLAAWSSHYLADSSDYLLRCKSTVILSCSALKLVASPEFGWKSWMLASASVVEQQCWILSSCWKHQQDWP